MMMNYEKDELEKIKRENLKKITYINVFVKPRRFL